MTVIPILWPESFKEILDQKPEMNWPIIYQKSQSIWSIKNCAQLKIVLNWYSISRRAKMQDYTFENLKVTFPSQYVIHVEFNRPAKLNALDETFVISLIRFF